MPRVNHVKAARKDNQGEPYCWWKFRYGGKHYPHTGSLRALRRNQNYLFYGHRGGRAKALASRRRRSTVDTSRRWHFESPAVAATVSKLRAFVAWLFSFFRRQETA